FANEVGLRAEIGEGRRVAREQAADAGFEHFQSGVGRVVHALASATNLGGGLARQAASAKVEAVDGSVIPVRAAARDNAFWYTCPNSRCMLWSQLNCSA